MTMVMPMTSRSFMATPGLLRAGLGTPNGSIKVLINAVNCRPHGSHAAQPGFLTDPMRAGTAGGANPPGAPVPRAGRLAGGCCRGLLGWQLRNVVTRHERAPAAQRPREQAAPHLVHQRRRGHREHRAPGVREAAAADRAAQRRAHSATAAEARYQATDA